MDKKNFYSHAIAFIIGCVFTGIICFSELGYTRQQLKQVRAERDRATEKYRELESTAEQLSNIKSEYDNLYIDIRESTGRIQNLTGNSLEIIRGCRKIITEIRSSMQSFEDNTMHNNTCGSDSRRDNNIQPDEVTQ